MTLKYQFATPICLALLAFSSSILASSISEAQTATPSATPTVASTPSDGTPAPEPTVVPASSVITSEGISGDVDKKRRGPLVSVGTQYSKGNGSKGSEVAKILVEAVTQNDDYKQYPIRVDFFINRNLFTSQMRSTELPGPLGVEITPDTARVPFSYSVVATLLHPNREFTTVIHGAVFATDLGSTLSTCTLTVTSAQSGGTTATQKVSYVAKDVQVAQSGNSAATVSFETSELEDGSSSDTVTTNALLSFAGTTVSGTLTTTISGRPQVVDVTGTGAIGGNGVSSFSVSSADKGTALACE
jgi:hypothetical protein